MLRSHFSSEGHNQCWVYCCKTSRNPQRHWFACFSTKANNLFALAKVHCAQFELLTHRLHYLIHILSVLLATSCACLLLSQQIIIISTWGEQVCHSLILSLSYMHSTHENLWMAGCFYLLVMFLPTCTHSTLLVCITHATLYLLAKVCCPELPPFPLLSSLENVKALQNVPIE